MTSYHAEDVDCGGHQVAIWVEDSPGHYFIECKPTGITSEGVEVVAYIAPEYERWRDVAVVGVIAAVCLAIALVVAIARSRKNARRMRAGLRRWER